VLIKLTVVPWLLTAAMKINVSMMGCTNLLFDYSDEFLFRY